MTIDAVAPSTALACVEPAPEPQNEAYFRSDQQAEIRQCYDKNGYVVVRGLIPGQLCDRARALFTDEVRPFTGFIYRQASANPERHILSNHGFMLNTILNVQSLNPRYFAGFRRAGVEILTYRELQRVVGSILGEPGKLVQSMYFEGNPETWAHQDTYYLDAEEIGRMTAAWIAIEDIAPGAGRFFVCPTSHVFDMAKNGGDFDVAFHHERYKSLVQRIIREQGLVYEAPALWKGDVLFWAAKTIHGSLPTADPAHSRSSFTAHFIPESSRFLQYQSRIKPLKTRLINGLTVHHPKDLAKASNRAVFFVETRFPWLFQAAKKLVIKLVTR